VDDKVLTDWNGLMIANLAFTSRVLHEPRYTRAAQRAAQMILRSCMTADGGLLHRYRDGEAAIMGQLDDYAFMIYGLIQLYEATFEESWLHTAKDLTDRMIRDFWDEEYGAFFMTSEKAAGFLITRPKEFQDGAMPSGNSMALLDLKLIGTITQEDKYEEYFEKTLASFSNSLTSSPTYTAQALIGLDFAVGPSSEIVIAGKPWDDDTQAMVRALYENFLPNKVVLLHPPGREGKLIESIAPFVENQTALGGKSTAYVCRNYVCRLPTNDLEKFKELLRQ